MLPTSLPRFATLQHTPDDLAELYNEDQKQVALDTKRDKDASPLSPQIYEAEADKETV